MGKSTLAESFDPDKPMRQATVQELQFELIRRTQFNAFDGERLLKSLLEHRSLWKGVIFDRHFVWQKTPCRLPLMMMIKLRDIEDNLWNSDTIFVLCEGRESAEKLKRIAESEWIGEVQLHDDQNELAQSLGTSEENLFILSVWWD